MSHDEVIFTMLFNILLKYFQYIHSMYTANINDFNIIYEFLLKLYVAYIELKNFNFIDFSIKIILHFSSLIL